MEVPTTSRPKDLPSTTSETFLYLTNDLLPLVGNASRPIDLHALALTGIRSERLITLGRLVSYRIHPESTNDRKTRGTEI